MLGSLNALELYLKENYNFVGESNHTDSGFLCFGKNKKLYLDRRVMRLNDSFISFDTLYIFKEFLLENPNAIAELKQNLDETLKNKLDEEIKTKKLIKDIEDIITK